MTTSAALPDGSRLPEARYSWPHVFRAAFSMDFEGIHRTPLWEQRRIGVAATILGALVAIVGMMIGFAIASFFGVSTRLFFLVAGWGSIMVGIGAYRVGISFFPFLAGTSRSASIARMFYVLVVMCVLGGSVLWFLLRDV